jgi:cysteine desulfurase
MKQSIYLDANASTFVDPRVLSCMIDNIKTCLGNPSSVHSFGRESRGVLTSSRHTVASYLNVSPEEVIFCSGGTEGLNLCLRGIIGNQFTGHIISSYAEHPAVFSTLEDLANKGCRLDQLSPDHSGVITPERIEKAIQPDTRLISLMAVNNETGVKTDIKSIASIAEKHEIPFVVDCVAWLGKEKIVIPNGVTAMCFSGHKIHAPRGVGAFFIRKNTSLTPLLTGGRHEYNKRSGTENLVGIVAFAKAIEILEKELPKASKKMKEMRDSFEEQLLALISGCEINGTGPRVVNTSNISFSDVEGELLLIQLDQLGIACSHGSACASGSVEPSRVLLSMKIPMRKAASSIRFSFSRMNTMEEVNEAVKIIAMTVKRIRSLTEAYKV